MVNHVGPLQNWMENIHEYLVKEEMIKARLASLAIPIFSFLGILAITKNVFFPSRFTSLAAVKENFICLTFLFWNILFCLAGYYDPKGHYRLQQSFGFTKTNSPSDSSDLSDILNSKTDLDENSPLISHEIKKTENSKKPPQPAFKIDQEKHLQVKEKEKYKLPSSTPPDFPTHAHSKSDLDKKSSSLILTNDNSKIHSQHAVKIDQEEHLQVKEKDISKLPTSTPLNSFANMPSKPNALDKIPSSSISVEENENLKNPPKTSLKSDREGSLQSKEKKVSVSSFDSSQPLPVKPTPMTQGKPVKSVRFFSDETQDKEHSFPVLISTENGEEDKNKLENILRNRTLPLAPSISAISLTSNSDKTNLPSIKVLLISNLEFSNIKKIQVKNKELNLKPSKKLHSFVGKLSKESKKLVVTAEAVKLLSDASQCCSQLNQDELLILRENLIKIRNVMKIENKQQMQEILTRIENQLITVWLADTHQQNQLIPTCRWFIQNIVEKIKLGEGHSNQADQSRLFRHTLPSEKNYLNMANWYNQVESEQQKFSIYDWYGLLSMYISSIPEEKKKIFESFKLIESSSAMISEIGKLGLEDQALVIDLLILLKISYEKIWLDEDLQSKTNQDQPIETFDSKTFNHMLTATPVIKKLLCPIDTTFQLSPTLNVAQQEELKDNMRNTKFLFTIVQAINTDEK